MALQTDHAWAASTNHFEFHAAAQSEFLEALHMFAAANDFRDDAALAVAQAIEGDVLFKGRSHGCFLIETHSHFAHTVIVRPVGGHCKRKEREIAERLGFARRKLRDGA